MKIAFLSTQNFINDFGGVSQHIKNLYDQFHLNGVSITIFQPIDKTHIANLDMPIGYNVIFIPIGNKLFNFLESFFKNILNGVISAFIEKAKFLIYRKKIANIILASDCEIIHQHDFIANIFSTKIISKHKKVILTNHTGEYLLFNKYLITKIFLGRMISHYAAIIGPSKELTPYEFTNKCYTIYNGADLKYYYSLNFNDKEQLKLSCGFSQNDFLVFCPRRWAPTKGVKYLIQSIAQLDYPSEIKFIFAGSDYDHFPKYREELFKIINENSDKFRNSLFLGNLNNREMRTYYQISNVSILPSLMEAVSLAAVESMACGCPVIATSVGGMPELINNNVNGLLIEPKSIISIRNSILSLFNNTYLYNDIMKESINTSRNFDWSNIAQQTLKVYEGLWH